MPTQEQQVADATDEQLRMRIAEAKGYEVASFGGPPVLVRDGEIVGPVPDWAGDAEACKLMDELVAGRWWIMLSHNGNQYAPAWDFRAVHRDDERKRHIAIRHTRARAIAEVYLLTRLEEGRGG